MKTALLLNTFLISIASGFLVTLCLWLCGSLLHRYDPSTNRPVNLTSLLKITLPRTVGFGCLSALYRGLDDPFHKLSTIYQIAIFGLFFFLLAICTVMQTRHKALEKNTYFQALVLVLTVTTFGIGAILIHQHLLS